MAGTREGGLKAAATNKLRYGNDMYINIGRLGGQKSRGGGFTSETGRIAGRKGGSAIRSHCRNGHKYPKDAMPDSRGRKCKTCIALAKDRKYTRKNRLTA
jgi:general stress protein YciG